ncbi:MAG: hypothetical protein HWD92_13050 [Flavobacteriia bacterium]|nr:hypothetical protein [Flavobacteriia bacterium]
MQIFKALGVFILIAVTFSCERDVINIVDGNQPPPDSTVSYQQRDRYIERVYITVLGRKPDSAEHANARLVIDQDPWDQTVRYNWLQTTMQSRDVSVKRWDDVRSELLEGVDTTAVGILIQSLETILMGSPAEQRPAIRAEIDKLERILFATDSLHQGVYSVRDLHLHAVNNAIYDDINMGAENFVVSVFDHFLYRYPTQFELDAAKRMVEGFQDVLFLQNGSTKDDFLGIFFTSDAYAEGQIRYVYLNYLFREPTTTELQTEKARYQIDYDFKALQSRILTSDEYFTI